MWDEFGDGWDEGGYVRVVDAASGGSVLRASCEYNGADATCSPPSAPFALPYGCSRASGNTPVVANLTTGDKAEWVRGRPPASRRGRLVANNT